MGQLAHRFDVFGKVGKTGPSGPRNTSCRRPFQMNILNRLEYYSKNCERLDEMVNK